MVELEQLKQLVLDGGFDAESKKQVSQLEDQFHQLIAAQNLVANPVIKNYLDYLVSLSDSCTYLLSNDRKLSDQERQILFIKRDLCDEFIKMFDGKEKQQRVETEIKSLLNYAQNA